MLPKFANAEDALLVFKNSTDRLAQMAAFDYLEKLLPQHVRDEMTKRANEILNLDKLTPGGFNSKSDPLYSAEQLVEHCGIPYEEVVSGIEFLQQLHPDLDVKPVDHPTLKPLPTSGRKGQYIKTEDIDEDGEPVYLCDGRAVLQMTADAVMEGNPKGIQILNQYCALAKQHGCPQKSIDRLKQAASREGGGGAYLKWLDRVAKFAPEENVIHFL